MYQCVPTASKRHQGLRLQSFFLDSKAKLTYEGRALAEAEQRKGASQLAESQARLEAVKQELHNERQISARSDALLNR